MAVPSLLQGSQLTTKQQTQNDKKQCWTALTFYVRCMILLHGTSSTIHIAAHPAAGRQHPQRLHVLAGPQHHHAALRPAQLRLVADAGSAAWHPHDRHVGHGVLRAAEQEQAHAAGGAVRRPCDVRRVRSAGDLLIPSASTCRSQGNEGCGSGEMGVRRPCGGTVAQLGNVPSY